MDVSSLASLYKTTPSVAPTTQSATNGSDDNDFGAVLDSVMNSVGETNSLQNTAQNEEIKFELGESDNTHDLMIAEQKANIALQYTVAVRDRFIQAYQTIMNMQI